MNDTGVLEVAKRLFGEWRRRLGEWRRFQRTAKKNPPNGGL